MSWKMVNGNGSCRLEENSKVPGQGHSKLFSDLIVSYAYIHTEGEEGTERDL